MMRWKPEDLHLSNNGRSASCRRDSEREDGRKGVSDTAGRNTKKEEQLPTLARLFFNYFFLPLSLFFPFILDLFLDELILLTFLAYFPSCFLLSMPVDFTDSLFRNNKSVFTCVHSIMHLLNFFWHYVFKFPTIFFFPHVNNVIGITFKIQRI